MTPSKYIKSQGLPSLAYVAKEAGVNPRTLHNWYHSKNKLFKTVVRGVVILHEHHLEIKIAKEIMAIYERDE